MKHPLDNCPKCNASLVGDPLTEEQRASGAWGNATHWRREIGIVANDRVVSWQCPDCGEKWPRGGTK